LPPSTKLDDRLGQRLAAHENALGALTRRLEAVEERIDPARSAP